MSLHEVTRAFQQVPATSNTSSPRRSSPPNTPYQGKAFNGSAGYQPPPSTNSRPGYPYHSPMIGHATPNMMYAIPLPGSPVPSRLSTNPSNGAFSPAQPPPIWMGPGTQHQNGMMRAVPPYHSPLLYPSHPNQGIYVHQAQPGHLQATTQPTVPHTNRDRPISMVSPVMNHSAPAMYGSPMMHASIISQNSPYMMSPQTHGPPRSEAQHSHQSRGPSHSNGTFNYVPQSPYRAAW
jgi:serine/arginine repetitive matrix protein 2